MRAVLRRAGSVAPPGGWLLVGLAFAIVVGHTLDRFRQWGPDSRYYLAWAYRYGGLSEREASARTYEFLGSYDWFRAYCVGSGCWPAGPGEASAFLFHGFSGDLVAPRVLYPLLSAPFVRLFGPQGMLAVSLLAYVGVIVLVMALASRLLGRRWAVVAGLAIVLPASVSRWATYAYTESLSMLLCLACIAVLPIGRRATRRDVLLFGVLLILFALTRQFHPVVAAAVAAAWLAAAVAGRRLRNEWLPFLAVAIGVVVLGTAVMAIATPDYSALDWFLRHSGAGTLAGVPAAVPRVVWRIIWGDLTFIRADLVLMFVLGLALLGAILRIRSALAHVAIGAALGTLLLNVLNTQPSFFRYYALVMPLLAVLAAAAVADLVRERAPAQAVPQPAAPPDRSAVDNLART